MLTIDNVTKRYGDFVAVNGLSMSIEPGTIFGFLGPNGAGKTTTMKMVCGLIRPTEGSIHVDGQNIVEHPLETKGKLGYVPDRPHVYERLTAKEYMYFIAGLYNLQRSDGITRSQELLSLFGLGHVQDHLVEL